MVSRLSLKAGDSPEVVRRLVFYSPSARINEILNRYAEEARADSIWISLNATEIHDEEANSIFCEVIETALPIIRKNCIESTRPRNRWIRLCCRIMQEKIFVKIEYSCENREVARFNAGTVKIHNILDPLDGFLDILLDGENAVMRIALPIETHSGK